MAKCKFTCNLATKRLLTQVDPATKQPISGFVFDAELSVTPNCEENKGFFIAQHGGALKFVACSEAFEAGKEYYLEITPAPDTATPATAAK